MRKLFISTSGSRIRWRRRSASVCRAMTSRNDSPSRASTSDLGPVIPIVVPSPPLSLTTTARPSASGSAASGRSAAFSTLRTGSSSASGSAPEDPASSSRYARSKARIASAG